MLNSHLSVRAVCWRNWDSTGSSRNSLGDRHLHMTFQTYEKDFAHLHPISAVLLWKIKTQQRCMLLLFLFYPCLQLHSGSLFWSFVISGHLSFPSKCYESVVLAEKPVLFTACILDCSPAALHTRSFHFHHWT